MRFWQHLRIDVGDETLRCRALIDTERGRVIATFPYSRAIAAWANREDASARSGDVVLYVIGVTNPGGRDETLEVTLSDQKPEQVDPLADAMPLDRAIQAISGEKHDDEE